MPEKANSQGTMDPMDLWKQWNSSTSAMWSNVMGGNKESFVDPYGLYHSWLKGMEEAQEQFKAGASKMINPEEFWKNWFETTTSSWRKAAESGADPFGLTTRWLEVMEEAREKMFAGGNMAADPFSFYKQWYDATSETWSKVVGDIISTQEFSHASSQYLDNYLSFIKTSRRVYEEYFKNLQLPTRSDIARVAGLVVSLEDKVDQVEDAVEDFEDHIGQMVTNDAFNGLTGRLDALESKLAVLPDAVEKVNALSGINGRLDTLEGKLAVLPSAVEKVNALSGISGRLDAVEQQLTTVGSALTKVDALPGLESRLSQVESKLDRVLAALESLNAQAKQAGQAAATPTGATPRRSKKNTNPAKAAETSSKTE